MNAVRRIIFGIALSLLAAFALAQQQPSSWEKTTEVKDATGSTVPTRVVESHREVNGRTIETRRVERLSINGGYTPSEESETETIPVDANTVKVVQRQYGRNPDGSRTLIGVTEEERRTSSDGSQSINRTRSTADVNGGLSVSSRETEQSVKTGADTQQTTTTVQTPDINGGFTQSRKTVSVENRQADGTTKARTQVLAPDTNGSWQTNEVRERTIQKQGDQTQQEDRVSRPDLNGNFAVTDRSVKREWKSSDGAQHQQQQNYSNLVPGVAVDGNLRLSEESNTVQQTGPNGEQTTQRELRQMTPGSPADGMHVSGTVIEVTSPDSMGHVQTQQTVRTSDRSGAIGVVSFDSQKTAAPGSVTVDISKNPEKKSAEKKQPNAPRQAQAEGSEQKKPH